MPIRDLALALLIVAIWGVNFVAIKLGVADVPPLLLTGLRFLFAAVPAVFFVRPPKAPAILVAAYGVAIGVVSFGLLFVAIRIGMPAGLSSLVMQMQAVFTMALAALFLGERPLKVQILGALVAGGGIVVIGSGRLAGAEMLPLLMVVGAAAAWGVANLITKRAGRIDMLAFVVWSSLAAPLPLFALSWVLEGPTAIVAALTHPTVAAVGSLAFLSYLATIVGFGLWSALLGRHPAATVAPFSLLVPVFGMSSTWLFLGEPVSPLEAAGGALVFAGLMLNVFGPRLLAARRAPA
ncbi:O-acetylserine/cysteine exporter [Siculibacillus lacustris]|uniref:O-acetylserine/cysteine exporter n=1 Tax=Siculibacillus lacustris TaxID=1549641 RepID=A0A4Q9VKM6_9HYPH|nr:EamA family transporter [Siculibacillus lacustris]TBW35973.1 O-acetylserine/cysteine exporter [Siculibacillus lacustris]